jgi:hypothetical protein
MPHQAELQMHLLHVNLPLIQSKLVQLLDPRILALQQRHVNLQLIQPKPVRLLNSGTPEQSTSKGPDKIGKPGFKVHNNLLLLGVVASNLY